MKGALGLRPVFHYREDRIRGHVQLGWLALLLIRVAENATGDTWRNLRHELDRMHLVTLATPAGRVAQRSALTPPPPRRPSWTPSACPNHHGSSTSPHPQAEPYPLHAQQAVVPRPHPTHSAVTLVSAHIHPIVCPPSAEVPSETTPTWETARPPTRAVQQAAFTKASGNPCAVGTRVQQAHRQHHRVSTARGPDLSVSRQQPLSE